MQIVLKKSKGESKTPVCRILDLCSRPSGVAVPGSSDLPLLPLSGFHSLTSLVATLAFKCCLLAINSFSFFLCISLCMEVCWNRNFHPRSVSAPGDMTQSHSPISQCGQHPQLQGAVESEPWSLREHGVISPSDRKTQTNATLSPEQEESEPVA